MSDLSRKLTLDVFIGEWPNLLIRWAHLIVGIGWIGTSFYFMGLDYSLAKERMNPGVMGIAWQVTAAVSTTSRNSRWRRPRCPKRCTGSPGRPISPGDRLRPADRSVLFPRHAVPDRPRRDAAEPWQAIAISVASLAAGWFVYDRLCRSKVGEHTALLRCRVFALILIASVLYTRCSPAAARSFMSALWSAPSWRSMCSG